MNFYFLIIIRFILILNIIVVDTYNWIAKAT